MSMFRRRTRGEDASLPLALIVVILVSGLVVVLVGRTITAQRQVSFDETYHGVLPAGDAGVQEAQFKLNSNAELTAEDGSTHSVKQFPEGETTQPSSGVVDGREFTWTVTRLDQSRWEIDSTAHDPRTDVDRRIVVTMRDQPLIALAAFAETLFAMSGSNTADSYNSSTGDTCTGQGFVGSNEDVVFSGNASGDCQTHNQRTVDQVVLYDWIDNPGDNADATRPGGMRCRQGNNNMDHRNCIETGDYPAARTEDDPKEFATDEAIAFIEDALNACEAEAPGGELTDYVASEDGTVLSPAPNANKAMTEGDFAYPEGHYCYENLDLDDDTTLHHTATRSNPVIVFVRNEVTLRSNQGQPAVDVACPDCEPDSTPVAGRLWIFALNGDVLISNHSNFAGVMWAPRATCKGHPSNAQADIFGSIICDTITNAGGWRFHYDETLNDETSGEFFPIGWTEQAVE